MSEVRYPTANSRGELLENIAGAVLEVGDGFEVGGACAAVPGLILARENRVIYSPNLHAIEGIRLKEELDSKVGLPVTIENDNSAAAWGEFRFGAGSKARYLVYVGLGTGIGGGVVAKGRLLRGAQGAGGELGHVTVQATDPRCACGNRGCLEAFASGSAIARRAREAAVEHPNSALGRLAARRRVLGEDVTELARKGDKVALFVLEDAGTWLGVGLAGFVNVFNPEVVAVGGGVMEAGELVLEAARREVMVRARPPSRNLAEIKVATLGSKSGILGAAALAKDTSSGEYLLGS